MMTLYNKEQTQDSITGYLWYDAPWGIIRAVYPFVEGNLLDIGGESGVMSGVIKTLKKAQGYYGFKAYPFGDYTECFVVSDTVMSSHVIEHIPPSEVSKFIETSINLSRKKIIHVVPDGDVNDKNTGTMHLSVFNRNNFLNLFKEYEDNGRLKRVHYGPIKGDRMDSLMYVGDVVKG